jgi:hypothetical protein
MTWKTCKLHGDDKPGVWGCPDCLRELREENKRMRHRIECLRGALKSAAGRAYEVAEFRLGDDCMEWAGDMEPPLMGSNSQSEREAACGRSAPLPGSATG